MVTTDQLNKKVNDLKQEVAALKGKFEEVAALKSKFEHFLLNYTNLEAHYGAGFVAKFLKE